METNDLKKLIGRVCLAQDPMSKKKEFKLAEIDSVDVCLYKVNGEIVEHIIYSVTLKQITIGRNRYREKYEYHRSFKVSGNRINL